MLLPTRRATVRFARAVATLLDAGDLVLVLGELGAGKTFLVRALVRARGVGAAIAVPSPTFTLVQEYDTPSGPLLHADLYRLRGGSSSLEGEVARLGLREQRSFGALVIVEWGEEAIGALGGDPTLILRLDRRQEAVRRVSWTGEKGAALTALVCSPKPMD